MLGLVGTLYLCLDLLRFFKIKAKIKNLLLLGDWVLVQKCRLFSKLMKKLTKSGHGLACLQAVTGGFIAENPFRSVIERHLGFLRRALPGTSG